MPHSNRNANSSRSRRLRGGEGLVDAPEAPTPATAPTFATATTLPVTRAEAGV